MVAIHQAASMRRWRQGGSRTAAQRRNRHQNSSQCALWLQISSSSPKCMQHHSRIHRPLATQPNCIRTRSHTALQAAAAPSHGRHNMHPTSEYAALLEPPPSTSTIASAAHRMHTRSCAALTPQSPAQGARPGASPRACRAAAPRCKSRSHTCTDQFSKWGRAGEATRAQCHHLLQTAPLRTHTADDAAAGAAADAPHFLAAAVDDPVVAVKGQLVAQQVEQARLGGVVLRPPPAGRQEERQTNRLHHGEHLPPCAPYSTSTTCGCAAARDAQQGQTGGRPAPQLT